jgi:hypothetical protein
MHDHQLIAKHNREEENSYDRRLRERREAKEAEERERKAREAREAEHQAQQRLAAQRSENWQEWFHRSFQSELLRKGPLHDAIAEFVCGREQKVRKQFEQKIAELQAQIKELQQKLSLDTRLAEMERALDARQAARDAAKRGATGQCGARGAPGERGPRGDRGPAGPPGLAAAQVIGWKIDRARYRAVPFFQDGKPGPAIELRDLFQQFLIDTRSDD